MKKILIFEANSLQALAIAKYIQKYSSYYIVGVVEEQSRFNTKNYNKIIVKNFLDIDIKEYDYILPMGAKSSYDVVTKYKELKYCNGIRFNINNLIVFDKPNILEIAQDLNIPIPITFYHIEDINSFPIFYKENFENGGGVRGIANIKEEIPTYNKLIYQEYIDTPSTYGVGFLAKDGEIVTYTLHKEIISYPKDGGSAVVIDEFNDPRVLEYTKKLLKEINYNGWGLAEFKYCKKRDDFVFMEINAKFWASIEFMLKSNHGFLEYLLGIKYKNKENKGLIFINRLFLYNSIDIVKNLKFLFSKDIVKESSLIFQIVRKIIPNNIIAILKKLIK